MAAGNRRSCRLAYTFIPRRARPTTSPTSEAGNGQLASPASAKPFVASQLDPPTSPRLARPRQLAKTDGGPVAVVRRDRVREVRCTNHDLVLPCAKSTMRLRSSRAPTRARPSGLVVSGNEQSSTRRSAAAETRPRLSRRRSRMFDFSRPTAPRREKPAAPAKSRWRTRLVRD